MRFNFGFLDFFFFMNFLGEVGNLLGILGKGQRLPQDPIVAPSHTLATVLSEIIMVKYCLVPLHCCSVALRGFGNGVESKFLRLLLNTN